MPKLNLSRLKLLPALLGWVFLFVALSFIAAMVIPSAHAAEPDPSQASGPVQNSWNCVRHKGPLGLEDGLDCATTGSATMTLISPERQPFKLWCGGGTCKGAGQQIVRSNAFVGVMAPVDFDLALRCHIAPPDTDALCDVAIKAVEVKK